MTKKQGIRALLFLVIVIGILSWLDKHYRFEPTEANLAISRRFHEMYTEPKDTWDGVLLGASQVDRAWAAPRAWSNCGMAVYPMSTDGCPFVLTSNLIEEVLKYQDISFVAVDLHGAAAYNTESNSIKIRRVVDNMKRSPNWYQAIQKGVDYMETYYPECMECSTGMMRASFYFPLIQFHSRLMNTGISMKDIADPGITRMKGVYTAPQHIKTKKVALEADEQCSELNDLQKQLLDDVIACAKNNRICLLFFKTPSAQLAGDEESINAAAAYVSSLGYPVLNFNEAEVLLESGMNAEEDFFDYQHLNAKGAGKFTDYFAGWIKEQVPDLRDHRGKKGYTDWEKAAEEYAAFYEESLTEIQKWHEKNPDETSYPKEETASEDE